MMFFISCERSRPFFQKPLIMLCPLYFYSFHNPSTSLSSFCINFKLFFSCILIHIHSFLLICFCSYSQFIYVILYNYFMFVSPRFLAYINKPSVYYLRRPLTLQTRKQLLKQLDSLTTKQLVSKSNPLYKSAYELIRQEKIDQIQKYQNSFLWSPQFSPNHFRYFVLTPIILLVFFLYYVDRVAVPKTMMQHKLRSGLRFPEMEKKGYLDGWYEEYIKKDKVLEFQVENLSDLQRLYKQGMLAKSQSDTIKKIEKKKSKFVRGDRNFVMSQFKTN